MHCVWPLILALCLFGVGAMIAADGGHKKWAVAGAAAVVLAQIGVFDDFCKGL